MERRIPDLGLSGANWPWEEVRIMCSKRPFRLTTERPLSSANSVKKNYKVMFDLCFNDIGHKAETFGKEHDTKGRNQGLSLSNNWPLLSSDW